LPESIERTVERINILLTPGVRENLIPRGLARLLIWKDGKMPSTGPNFAPQLSDDLLDYGYTLLRLALVLHESRTQLELARTAFERAAEAIESVVRNGNPEEPDLGFHRVIASCSYHLAHYSARSYSLMPSPEPLNLAPTERCLAYLLRRSLSTLRESCLLWLADPDHADDRISEQLAAEEGGLDLDDVFQLGLTATFMKAMSVFDFALVTGNNELALEAVERFTECEDASAELGTVASWWTSKLAKNLVGDLWEQSLHRQLPSTISGEGGANWENLRSLFISLLQSKRVAQIGLWPSQLDATKRVTTAEDDLVVSLPTSAGKTRIAEMCILRALSGQRRVVYVTPLRALSAQVERDLRDVFQPLGFTVSALYGASGEVGLDADTLSNRDIVVSTPEKLDFALRQDPTLLDDVGLIVLDEAHTIGPGEREVRYEVLVQRLLRRSDSSSRRLVCLSAILPRGEQLDDFVAWIRQGDPGEAVIANWRPTRQRFGTIRWNSTGQYARLDLAVENEAAFIQRFIIATKVPKANTRMFPKDSGELTLAAAWQIAQDGRSALIFCPQKNLVASLAKKLLDVYQRGALQRLIADSPELERAKRVGREWLGAGHPAVLCLDVGVAVHHAGLPKAYLREVEGLLRARRLPIVIASPTLAQGLNLSASTLLMYSIRRGSSVISGEDFGNVIGRAGRAHVDIDGQILYVLFEPTQYRLRVWETLKAQARAKSGSTKNLDMTKPRCSNTWPGTRMPGTAPSRGANMMPIIYHLKNSSLLSTQRY
jgi:superfamily II DNA/RNA helicase